MKILFVTPPYHCGVVEVAGRWVPLQFVYLAGSARDAGHESVIYDAMTKFHDHETVLANIIKEKPDVVAISAITSSYPDSIDVLRNVKKALPKVKTILGGVHSHFMTEEVLGDNADCVDLVLRGEGESSFAAALAALGDKDKLHQVPGAAFVDSDKIIQVPKAPYIENLDELPAAFDLLDWSDYRLFVIKDSRLGSISTSRGCHHDCSFCSQQKFWDKSWRARSPEKVVEEIKFLRQTYGVNVLLLTDEYPTSDRERWEKLLDLLIAAKSDVHLLMETRVEDILRDRDILPKYRKAGILHVYLGVEATDQATLDLIKKDIVVEQSIEALALLRQYGMVTETSFVLGLPDETPDSIEKTFELAKVFDPDNAHFLAMTPWPYADFYPDMEPYVKVFDYRKYNLIEPIIEPKAMTLTDIDRAMIDCYRKFYMGKMKDFIDEPDPFRRHYLLLAAKLIMKSSFIKDKMVGNLSMPPEMKKLLDLISKIMP